MKLTWQRPQIEAFFGTHGIQLTKDQPTIDLLQKQVEPNQDFSLAFLPTIAHFKILRENIQPVQPEKEHLIPNAKRGLHQLNHAMILQTLHRPTENTKMKLNDRLVDHIETIGSYDMQGVIKKTNKGETAEAFLFDRKRRGARKSPLNPQTTQTELSPKRDPGLSFDQSEANNVD